MTHIHNFLSVCCSGLMVYWPVPAQGAGDRLPRTEGTDQVRSKPLQTRISKIASYTLSQRTVVRVDTKEMRKRMVWLCVMAIR